MTQRRIKLPDYPRVALVLQGGGALGSYQAGVYEGLANAGIHPNWVAGISIGAFNCAIIAGNSPEKRVEKLNAFGTPSAAHPCLTMRLGRVQPKSLSHGWRLGEICLKALSTRCWARWRRCLRS